MVKGKKYIFQYDKNNTCNARPWFQNSLEKYSTFNFKKKPTKAHRISHNNNDILVKCMKYKTVCISFKNFQL